MNKLLRPDRFNVDPNSSKADQEWTHWKTTFENFISSVDGIKDEDKLQLLVNSLTHSKFEFIAGCKKYVDAINALESAVIKPNNEIFARHNLMTRRQQFGENIDQYVLIPKQLAKDYNFQAVTSDKNRDD